MRHNLYDSKIKDFPCVKSKLQWLLSAEVLMWGQIEGTMKRKAEVEIEKNPDPELDKQLIDAINNASLDLVKKLIDEGAMVDDSISPDGSMPLLLAFSSKQYGIDNCLNIVKCLIDAGAGLEKIRPNHLLHDAILNYCKKTLRFLLDHNVSPNAKCNGLPALHLTCKELGNTDYTATKIDLAKLLLEKGADVNALGDGMTPLHYLCHIGGIEVKQAKEKASKLIGEQSKKQAEKQAEKLLKKQAKFAKLLIKKKADIEALYDGLTPLQHAIKNNLKSVVEVLITSGANFLTPYKGKTSIENAYNTEVEKVLIDTIKTNRPDEWNDNLLHKNWNDKLISLPQENKKTVAQEALRLFGHIFNDIDLAGSSLQGSYLYDTAKYMHDFITRFLSNKSIFPDILLEKEPTIKARCQELLELLEGVILTTSYPSDKKVDLLISHFEQKGRVLVPGGGGRHGMMYEFNKDQNGDCIFLVWNTGRGINYHLYENTADNRLYYPVKAYKIPPYEKLDKTAFKDYLSLLLEFKDKYYPEITNPDSFYVDSLYKEIIPRIAVLKGKEFEPIDFLNHKYEGQWSGTCGWQVIMMMCKHYGFTELSADEFQYELLIDGLERFLGLLTDDDYQSQDVVQQLQYAVKNVALFLQVMESKNNLNAIKKERALTVIKKINYNLQNTAISLSKDYKFEFHPNRSIQLSRRIPSIEVKLFEENDQLYKPFMGYQPLDNVNLVAAKELKTIIQAILETSTENANTYINLLRRMEHIIFNLPNNEAYWAMSSEEINKFIHLLTLFSEKYFNLCKTLNFHYAENIVALRICYGLGVMLAKINDPSIILDEHSRLEVSDLENEMQSEHLTISQERIALSILKFKLPETDLIDHGIESASKNRSLQNEAINNIKSLEKKLYSSKITNASDIPPQLIPAIYYCLKRQQSGEIAQKYPEVEQHFQVLFSVLALKDLHHWALGGFIANLKEIQTNKWNFIRIEKDDYFGHIQLKFELGIHPDSKKMSRSHKIKDNKIAEDLVSNFDSQTQIEIRIHSAPLSKEIDFRRRLAHIRSRPESKIVAAIEFIKSSLVQLNSKDLQTCLFLFLFQGDNLSREIKINQEAIDHLFNCIAKGIEYYQDQKSPSTLLFFYKLNTFLNQFLIHSNIESSEEQYALWITQGLSINNNIEQLFDKWSNKQNKNHHNRVILTTINYLQLLHLYNIHTFCGELSNDQWRLFFISNCLLSQLPVEKLDPFVIKEVDKAVDALRCNALTANFDPAFMLSEVCDFFKVKFDKSDIQGSFPYFHDNYCGIDLVNGFISQENVKEISLPRIIYNDTHFKALFGMAQIKTLKITTNAYRFTFNNHLYRVTSQSGNIIIQKNSFGKWFQLLKNNQLKDFGKINDKMVLPLTLVDETKYVWQAQDGSYIVSEKESNTIQYMYDGDEGTVFKLNGKGLPQWELDRANPELDVIKKFEDAAYTEIWHDIETGQVVINLPRYGLQFYSVSDRTPLQFTCKGFENYQLVLHKSIPIRNFEHTLILEPIDSKLNLETLYLVPKQVFLPTKEEAENDTYYKLSFDLQNKFKSTAYSIKKLNKKYGKTNLSNKEQITLPEENNYQNQEQFAIYTESKEGELTTQNVSDQFYLAYLYFAKREVQKCYNLLQNLVHAVSGNEYELTYLRYIVTETPCQIIDQKLAQQCTSRGPEFLSIRLFVLYILIEYFKSGEKLKISSNNKIKGEVNKQTAILCQEQQEKFLDKEKFQNILENTIFLYLKREKDIPKAMRLNSTQLLAILSSLNMDITENVQYNAKKKELMLKRLAKEYHALSNPPASKLEKQQTRRQIIEEKLAKDYQFIPFSSQLDEKQESISMIDLKKDCIHQSKSTPQTSNSTDELKMEIISIFTKDTDKDNHYLTLSLPLKIEDLSPKTDDKMLNENVINLYYEAKTDEIKESRLLEFLSNRMQSVLANKEWFINERPSTVGTIMLMMAMLKNKAKTEEIMRACAKNPNKLISSLLSHFENENYSGSTKIHKVVKSNKNAFTIENKSALKKYTLFASRNIKPLEGNQLIINHPMQNSLFHANGDHSFVVFLAKEMNADLEAGVKINNEAEQRNKCHLQYYDEKTRLALLNQMDSVMNASCLILDKLKQEIELIINAGNSSMNDQQMWELGKVSKSIKLLTIDGALDYFGKYHFSIIQEKRRLLEDTTHDLIEKIQQYLIEGTKQQKQARIKCKLLEINDCRDEYSRSHLIVQLGDLAAQERCYNPKEFPEILLFEYRENKLIYEIQYKIILKLLEKNENGIYISKVLQHIMGGGKSKVILPLLVRLRADGTNLCIVEVPPELFEIFFNDLSSTSLKGCGQKVFPFKFHRNMKCDADYFHYLRNKLRSVIANKNYILTTKKSMDSLMLKYIDMLTFPQASEDYLKGIKYLDEIINIINNQGDCIIEEIDSTLAPKDQLIYTVGESNPVEKHLLRALMKLYDFLPLELFNVIKGETFRPQAEILEGLFSSLTNELVESSSSPLYSIVNKLDKEKQQQILHYLQNKITDNNDVILQLPSQERDLLALYKEELSRLLPISVMNDCDEHYGLSKDKNKDPLKREVAIPYLGNNTPNEPAHFQNHFLTINYTIQAQLKSSLSYYIFKNFIHFLKEQYEIEKTVNIYSERFVGNIQSEFEKIINRDNLRLDDINLDDKEQMSQLYDQLKDGLSLKKYCLTEFILPSILKNNETLASDSQNHIDMYRSAVGFTGTDYNFRTFHPSIVRDNTESVGTDGQTIHHLLKSPNQRTQVMQQNKFSEIFTLIDQHPHKERVRAIIDRGAIFKGVRNREVANKLSYQFSQASYEHCDIKYILYFNSKDQLCAIRTSQTPEEEKPIVFSGTEDIDEKLNCTPQQRFTYYPQDKTTGIDIKQAINTIGLLPLSEHNTLRDLTQAAARFRDLKGSHSVEFVIMKGLASANSHIKQWDTPTTLNVAFQIQTKYLMKNSHLTAALQKIRNVFRSDLLDRIKTEKNIDAKIKLAGNFRGYLYDRDNLSFFEKYGNPETMIKTEQLLLRYQNGMAKRWLDCFADQQAMEPLRNKLIEEQCQEIIKEAIAICEQLQKSNVDFGVENQVIAQNEVQYHRQQQTETYNEVEESNEKTSVKYLSWKKVDWHHWYLHEKAMVPCYKLNEVTLDPTRFRDWSFSDNIYLSYNFLNTCKEVPGALNTFSKTCHYTLVVLHEGIPKHLLITEEEAAEIRALFPTSENNNICIETISGIPYVGKRLKGNEECELIYKNNVEQVKYFNGDIAYLIGEGTNLTWFKSNYREKMAFFDKILSYHPSKASLLPILKKIVVPNDEMELDTEQPSKSH